MGSSAARNRWYGYVLPGIQQQRVVARICVVAVGCNRLRIAQHKHKHSPWPLASFEYEWLAGGKSKLYGVGDGGLGGGCSGLRGLLRSIDVLRRPRLLLLLLCLLRSC